jgi:hypothetical protein
MRFADGSLAAICYGCPSPTAGKEWLEVSVTSHRLVIDSFRSAVLDGRTLWRGRADKGHLAQVKAFWTAISSGDGASTKATLTTMRQTIIAAKTNAS